MVAIKIILSWFPMEFLNIASQFLPQFVREHPGFMWEQISPSFPSPLEHFTRCGLLLEMVLPSTGAQCLQRNLQVSTCTIFGYNLPLIQDGSSTTVPCLEKTIFSRGLYKIRDMNNQHHVN